jgi:hypothetical protein
MGLNERTLVMSALKSATAFGEPKRQPWVAVSNFADGSFQREIDDCFRQLLKSAMGRVLPIGAPESRLAHKLPSNDSTFVQTARLSF